jgi:hypothetical protein
VTRRQSPVQITALGIIALPHSQERHARQHHEPARALEKSIEPGRTHPIPPAFSPTEFLRRLRSAETLISFGVQLMQVKTPCGRRPLWSGVALVLPGGNTELQGAVVAEPLGRGLWSRPSRSYRRRSCRPYTGLLVPGRLAASGVSAILASAPAGAFFTGMPARRRCVAGSLPRRAERLLVPLLTHLCSHTSTASAFEAAS